VSVEARRSATGRSTSSGQGRLMRTSSWTPLSASLRDPARELRLVRAHVAADDVDGAEEARVRGEDAGDGRDEARRVGAHGLAVAAEVPLNEVGVGEGERRAAPDGAPAAGKRGGAHGVLGGEAGDDVAENREGESAEAVLAGGVGAGARGEEGGGVDGGVREGGVDVVEDAPGAPFQFLRVLAAAPCFGRRRGTDVHE
jgi:hypothetical protein